MKKLNIVFSVVLIAVAAFFFFYADTFKMLPGQTEIGPGAFPKAVCVGLAVCGVLLIIQELRKGGSEKAELFSKKLLIGIAAAVAYFVLLKILGFVLDSIWVVFVMMALLLNEPFKKAWPLMLAVSILAPVVLYAIFGMFLKVPLPNGILSGLLGRYEIDWRFIWELFHFLFSCCLLNIF